MSLVLDSSFLIGLANERDAHHAAALDVKGAIDEGHWAVVLLPEYVFLETVTVLMARRDLAFARRFGRALLEAREIELVPSTDLFLQAWDLFRAQEDGQLSFTDAAIVATCRAHGAEEIATFDTGFSNLDGLQVVPAS